MKNTRETGRYELKFVAAECVYHSLQVWLRQHSQMFMQPYPDREVNSVYFDRFEYDSYVVSTEGSSTRSKLRYRWYGDSLYPTRGQLEVKIRRNRLGWKESYPVAELPEGLTTWREVTRAIRDALPSEARYWLLEYGWPIITARYEREYWVSRASGIRITLDRNLSIYDQRLSPKVNVTSKVEMPRVVVMEFKAPASAEKEISRLVSDLPLSLTRHSKYCAAVDTLLGI